MEARVFIVAVIVGFISTVWADDTCFSCTKPYKEHDTSGQKRCMWDITNKKDPAALCAQKSSCNTVQLVEDEIGVGKKIYCVYYPKGNPDSDEVSSSSDDDFEDDEEDDYGLNYYDWHNKNSNLF
ncbi:hypothetical protein ScPMuIL_015877 [Solemya velum]